MNTVRLQTHTYCISYFRTLGTLNHNFIIPGLHNNLIMHTFENNGVDYTCNRSLLRCGHNDILWTHYNIYLGSYRHIIKTDKVGTAEMHHLMT